MNGLINKAFSELVPLEKIKELIAAEASVENMADFKAKLESVRRYDNQTRERRNYWGEVAIEAQVRLGELIKQGQEEGTIAKQDNGRPKVSHGGTLNLEDIGLTRNASSRAQKAAEVPAETRQEYYAAIKERDDCEVTQAGLMRFVTGAHVSNNTGQTEWYTPPEYLEAARKTLCTIDLDPASSDIAQELVQADVYYTEADNGLSQQWSGRVFMNPPYAPDLVKQFTAKLTTHFINGDVSAAVVLVNNATETRWFQEMASNAGALCFPCGRVQFLDADGRPGASAPLQGQAICYLGRAVKRFCNAFSEFGVCMEVL